MNKESLKKVSEVLNIIKDTATNLLGEQNRIHATLRTALIGLNKDQLTPLQGLQKAIDVFVIGKKSSTPILWDLSISLMNLDRNLDKLIQKTEE